MTSQINQRLAWRTNNTGRIQAVAQLHWSAITLEHTIVLILHSISGFPMYLYTLACNQVYRYSCARI